MGKKQLLRQTPENELHNFERKEGLAYVYYQFKMMKARKKKTTKLDENTIGKSRWVYS